eukprot:CAMPEP_0203802416 /NCGR_PEP_ID=MMETSP0100_2-20121128/12069_1 /ASSEMBLY_ACC=CAM_ASM_000210 /TAXON_ID=96639 /ORGANISM=" , Strain NY0313808BC1" /LENGTH=770 /DNA_ID=CAMNT_0050709625 /DNA_START=95 /DNA_END=2407 /DNA_ORIENTATION=+
MPPQDGEIMPEDDRSALYMEIAQSDTLPQGQHVAKEASPKVVIDECIRRLRTSGDGGEADMDKEIAPGITFRAASNKATFKDWTKDGCDRGIAEWALSSEQLQDNDCSSGRILFVHGGGYEYYSPSDEFYRPLTSRLAKVTGMPVLSVDYRLAPEHPFPAYLEDVLVALAFIWENGPNGQSKAERVFLIGDSAGGGAAFGTFVALQQGHINKTIPLPPSIRREHMPTGIVGISPYVDATASAHTYRSRAWQIEKQMGDPVFSDGKDIDAEIEQNRTGAKSWVGEADPKDPCVSPMFAQADTLKSLPPTLLIVGDAEVMLGECAELAAHAVKAGATDVDLRVYPRMWHVFPMYSEACGQGKPGTLTEAVAALEQIADFCRNTVCEGDTASQNNMEETNKQNIPTGSVEFELKEDVYATAFVLARNATPDMYSFSPFQNPQMRLIWAYLIFIIFTQAFALLCLVIISPTTISSDVSIVNCANPSPEAFEYFVGVPPVVTCEGAQTGSEDTCASTTSNVPVLPTDALLRCLKLPVVFEADLNGVPNTFRQLERETYFYENVFQNSFSITMLQLVCGCWVTVQLYYSDFVPIASMLEFVDYSNFMLPLKGEKVRENIWWTMLIPLLQFCMSCAILSVSWVVTCGADNATDIVLNCAAFSFISDIAELFSSVAIKYYSTTAIAGLDPNEYGTDPIYYLVSEYDPANAYDDPETQWVNSWYVREDWDLLGALSDFHFKHSPDEYSRPWTAKVPLFRVVYFATPLIATLFGFFVLTD